MDLRFFCKLYFEKCEHYFHCYYKTKTYLTTQYDYIFYIITNFQSQICRLSININFVNLDLIFPQTVFILYYK